ncbi:hypothetical protein GOBAR_DD32406 [Gossypium barbadense]|nr:hypothetical protein GOBAR_DD32406 [Gossypium barbadense]
MVPNSLDSSSINNYFCFVGYVAADECWIWVRVFSFKFYINLEAYVPLNNRIHYSGPLMPPGENLDEMLKEHERQIQDAVRKARLDKTETLAN